MWRDETGFLEMFLAYYWQFSEQSVASAMGYRQFLFDVLSYHELGQTHQGRREECPYEDNYADDRDVKPPVGEKQLVPSTLEDLVFSETQTKRASSVRDSMDEGMETRKKKCSRKSQSLSGVPEIQQRQEDSTSLREQPKEPADYVNDSIPDARSSLHTDSSPVKEADIERRRFFCVYCDNVFETAEELQEHSLAHRGDRPFFCVECPKTFKTKNALRLHYRLHTGERPFACHFCERTFVSQDAMKRHESSEHKHRSVYVCVVCDKRFRSEVNLSKHEALHRGERPFKCQYCPQTFTQRCYMKVHERKHTGDEPYKCDQCPKKFNNKSHCIAHMRVHNDEIPFVCRICNRGFKTASSLKVHKCNPNIKQRKEKLLPRKVRTTETNKQEEEQVNEQMPMTTNALSSQNNVDLDYDPQEMKMPSNLAKGEAASVEIPVDVLCSSPPYVNSVSEYSASQVSENAAPVSSDFHVVDLPGDCPLDALAAAASVITSETVGEVRKQTLPHVRLVPSSTNCLVSGVIQNAPTIVYQPLDTSPGAPGIYTGLRRIRKPHSPTDSTPPVVPSNRSIAPRPSPSSSSSKIKKPTLIFQHQPSERDA